MLIHVVYCINLRAIRGGLTFETKLWCRVSELYCLYMLGPQNIVEPRKYRNGQ